MKMKTRLAALVTAATLVLSGQVNADTFFPIDDVTVTYPDDIGGAFWPESNLIQGPGVGFEEDEPHDKIGGGADANWVTTADAGFPSDYVEDVGMPIIELDLGQDRALTEISTWGYEDGNTNGMREFQLRFANSAEGPAGYGSSVTYNPTFIVEDFFDFTAIERRSFEFSEPVTARYVEMLVTDNYFDDPGDGTGEEGWGPGGDRVGIGEIAFRGDDTIVLPPKDPPVQFYNIDDIVASTADTDLYPATNLIQGPGEGFDEEQPHGLAPLGGPDGLWVTEACGFPCDYLESFDPPELIIDLGEDVALDEINIWGYSASNSNGVLEFELEFATDADGDDGFGQTVSYNPSFDEVEIDPSPRQVFEFDETVTARYVKVTTTDNYFEDPGDGNGENGFPPGGDRIGLGEIAFPIPTGMTGDFDGDGMLDIDDINILVGQSASGANAAGFDLTGDSLVNVDDVRNWVTDLKNTWIGDSNLDGEFNSSDLVTVFQSGKFETGETANWSEGDWSGDGVFDSSDFVIAFQGGGFELGPRAATASVPEPTSAVLALLGMVTLGFMRRR